MCGTAATFSPRLCCPLDGFEMIGDVLMQGSGIGVLSSSISLFKGVDATVSKPCTNGPIPIGLRRSRLFDLTGNQLYTLIEDDSSKG